MSNCVLWAGSTRGKGYGQVYDPARKSQVGAHVLAWEKENGRPVPQGMVVMHSCNVKLCVNPEHLLLGTHGENNSAAIRDGLKPPPPQDNERDPKTGRFTRRSTR